MAGKEKPANGAGESDIFNSSTAVLVKALKPIYTQLHDEQDVPDLEQFLSGVPESDFQAVSEIVQESLGAERPDTAFLERIGPDMKEALYAYDDTAEGPISIDAVPFRSNAVSKGPSGLRPNPAVGLMEYFLEADGLEVFKDRKGEAHIRLDGKVYSLSDSDGRNAVTRLCLQHEQVGQTVTNVISALEAKALDAPIIDVRLRTAIYKESEFIINPSWDSGQVIRVTTDGWKVSDFPGDADFVFLSQDSGTFGLVEPEAGGDISLLQQFLNVDNPDDIPLVGALFASFLLPEPPYPIVVFMGEGGTAKTTAAFLLVQLIDHSDLDEGISPPKESRNLFVHADKHHVVYLDNVTVLNGEQSADLSRLVQGAGHMERAVYKNKDTAAFKTASPVIITAINSPTTKTDLVNRSIVINFKYISETERRVKGELLDSWQQVAPKILGLFLDGLVAVLQNEKRVSSSPLIKRRGLPRNADNAVALIAMSEAFGWDEENMLEALLGNAQNEDRRIIEESPIGERLIKFLQYHSDMRFEGNHTGLLKELTDIYMQDLNDSAKEQGGGVAQLPNTWPQTPEKLSKELRSVLPSLRKVHGLKKVDKARRRFELSLPKGALAETSAQPDDSNIGIADQQKF